MHLLFLYGPPASGKYTIARIIAEQTGLPLFHNHLIVDAVAAVFPFGSANFIRLREQFWLETLSAAIEDDRSLIFTFAPENSVSPDFATKVKDRVENAGGTVTFVQLDLSRDALLSRVANADRAKFGKLRDVALLRANFEQFEACVAAMPPPDLRIDTEHTDADTAAREIVAHLSFQT